jgi:hypothetical protein
MHLSSCSVFNGAKEEKKSRRPNNKQTNKQTNKQLEIGQFFTKNKIPVENQKLTGGNIVAGGIAEQLAGCLDSSAWATDGAINNSIVKRKLDNLEGGPAKKVKVGGSKQGWAFEPRLYGGRTIEIWSLAD